MQLKFSKDIKNKVITIALETINFSPEEIKWIDDLGEPLISFEKTYGTNHIISVKFDRKIKTGFKIVQKFDGTVNLQEAALAAEEFMTDVEMALQDAMSQLRDSFLMLTFAEESGLKDIVY